MQLQPGLQRTASWAASSSPSKQETVLGDHSDRIDPAGDIGTTGRRSSSAASYSACTTRVVACSSVRSSRNSFFIAPRAKTEPEPVVA
ncbi:hypothetical protein SVIOM342S_06997 [Streptomyces violaceorubidus]